MNRAQRIFTHGWLSGALSVLTLGYFGGDGGPVAVGKLCLHFALTLPRASAALALPGLTLGLALPGIEMTTTTPNVAIEMTMPSATLTIEECDG